MEGVSLNSEPINDDEAEEYEIEGDCGITEFAGQSGFVQGEIPLHPAVGMEFETYEDVYFFYNCYAKERGFGVRVSNTWYRKGKERYRGKLSCSSAGFKKRSEANRPRPETRTGCPAMIKFRLMDSNRWRIIEVELEHNHLISPATQKVYKSHRKMGVGSKRSLQTDCAEEARKIQLFRTVIIDTDGNGGTDINGGELGINADYSNQLKLRGGDALALHNYFCRMQLTSPDFFYVMDISEKGCLRNTFWVDTRSRAAYVHFGDVIAIDISSLADKLEVVAFVGVNHHGQSVLLGSGLIAGETLESFTWLLRAWLTCMLGRPPQVIITDQCQSLQTAIADVFPRASHCLRVSHVIEMVPEKLGDLHEFESIRVEMSRIVYHSLREDDFEVGWEDMIQRHGISSHDWLKLLFEDRKRWVPVYLKEAFLAGMLPFRQGEHATPFFEGFLHRHASLQEFFDKYDQAVQTSHQEESLADTLSRNSTLLLKSRYYFEFQLSKLYTNEIFKKFQGEVEGMYACFGARKVSVEGPNATYIVSERVEVDENRRETVDYEVMYNASEAEVVCVCGLFNFKGYLCRHALNVLNENGLEEIPPQYILQRWRKDVKRTYLLDDGVSGIDKNNSVSRYDQLHKRVMQVVDEGRKSQDRYKNVVRALDKILGKLLLVEDHPM